MSRQSTEFAGSKPRLLVSAVGVAITAMSGTHLAHADEAVPKKSGQDVLSLDADTVVGAQQQDPTTYNVEKSSNEKYTAPLLETPKTVTVIPQQVIKDTGALTLQDALRSTPGITFVPARAATRRATVRSSVVSTPRAIHSWMACAMWPRKPARSSTSNRSK